MRLFLQGLAPKDWVVVCAVGYEPVSTWNSLLSTVLQGNFCKVRGFAEFWSPIVLQLQRLTAKFPVQGSREFFKSGREAAGKSYRGAGNQPADEQLRSIDSGRKLHARPLQTGHWQGNRVKEQTTNPISGLMPYLGISDSHDANLWSDAQSEAAFPVWRAIDRLKFGAALIDQRRSPDCPV